MPYQASPSRYENMQYRYCGRSGLQLPALSLGLWHNFGHISALESQRDLLRKAFDLGITHFDLANNYGPPPGSAEENFGRLLREDFAPYRDELIISTKAGYDMWPGPYGSGGSRKYLLSSLDQSLQRMGLEYVDIFYSHRVDEKTPMEETASALAHAVQSGKALYVGISSYSPERTQKMTELLREWKIPLTDEEGKKAFLHRFAAAGAAVRYHAVHEKEVEDILALDIALRRNDRDWFETLPAEIDNQLVAKLYYGHFMCHVFHQDYIVKKGADSKKLKHQMLEILDAKGAEYPAEHNVGHLYIAKPHLKAFYQQADPTNSFNPGIGKTSKLKGWRE